MDPGDGKRLLREYFRCPEEIPSFTVAPGLSQLSGFFRLNAETICFGQCSSIAPASSVAEAPAVATANVKVTAASIELPFDPVQVVENLRRERYISRAIIHQGSLGTNPFVRSIYYLGRPFMPTMVRKHLQQAYFRGWDKVSFPKWPVDLTVENISRAIIASRDEVAGH